jgi:hypothetical protein
MPSGRYVVGKAVLFPLLSHYPEKYPADGRELVSHAGQRDFIAAYLDQLPSSSPAIFTQLWNSLGLKSYTTTRLDLVDEYFSIEPAQQK